MADFTITPANVIAAVAGGTATAGAAITAGQVIYRKSSDQKVYLAVTTDANTSTPIGVALNNAAIGQPISYLANGALTVGSAFGTERTLLTVSDTPGGIRRFSENGAGDFLTVIGWITSATTMYIDITPTGVAMAAA